MMLQDRQSRRFAVMRINGLWQAESAILFDRP
jgi:hypothetical protein